MLRFSANLTFLFREFPLTERFAAAREAGFEAVEILSMEDSPIADVVVAARDAGVSVVMCNAPMGDFIQGGCGLSAVPGRQLEFRLAVEQAAEIATALGCRLVHLGPSRIPRGATWQDCYNVYLDNVVFASGYLAAAGICSSIEPLNTVDMPDIFLSTVEQALGVLDSCAQESLQLQFDVYHISQMDRDYLASLRLHIGRIAHIQIADVPGRGEPGSGGVDFAAIFSWLKHSSYGGWIGAEYKPSAGTAESLGWFEEYRA